MCGNNIYTRILFLEMGERGSLCEVFFKNMFLCLRVHKNHHYAGCTHTHTLGQNAFKNIYCSTYTHLQLPSSRTTTTSFRLATAVDAVAQKFAGLVCCYGSIHWKTSFFFVGRGIYRRNLSINLQLLRIGWTMWITIEMCFVDCISIVAIQRRNVRRMITSNETVANIMAQFY